MWFPPAEHFGVVIDDEGRVTEIFNPDHDWEFQFHNIGRTGRPQIMHILRKEDWGIPMEPNAMTFDMCYRIHHAIEAQTLGKNYRPGDELLE